MDLNYILSDFSRYQQEITLILIFLIIFIIVFAILKKVNLFENSPAVPGILALVVSLISVWYLSEKQILTIISSYNILGFFIVFLLPFALIFLFLHKTKTTSIIRKSVWVVFGCIFTYVWYKNNNTDDIFFWISIILILGAIFLDESIHKGLQQQT